MSQTATTTVDPGEIQRFSAIAAEWWDEAGKFRPLHKLNPVRLEYLRDRICAHFGRDPLAPQPLRGLRLVDIGCGGGLLSEPLARMGADVVGIDAAERNVKTAATHAMETATAVDYRHTTAEALVAAGEKFDAVLSLEVVEHVADVPLFLDSLAALMKPEGLLVMATLNRTPKSYLMAIIGAEYVLRWLPRGTHDWRKFLKPSELAAGLRATGLTVREVMGLVYSPFNDTFRLDARDLDVNYLLWASR
ncbi:MULTISPECIES: bifunctional 2-polyprenyl-6-hydroxyphenol methylase/3-demethylubiquinol 3-O-methyltransferase UbiG [Nitrospirillum]|uniref:Ubiquinone biosynthesis O-methyltransferase n=1 Tax=Nitrospirillum amazonense TaxID=28077 RepID=A0A560FQP9_9PROT|nr:bifunctional 2-polyprenyl-6-hydroxyphenol methylase/3-demethylubiquinol 3-O-methyltransferase UbiG [Nitrospirillum amazonense]MEC4594359.1 bifunctional 2-polyprenyl-6-hydroxyphenol methylase/3-demethylubiquinol 3-O-methyltransferase UbiG [Nitrospirillum amazonense]TWB23942.1 3-demethylubiquinone-9 3-methyltransferase [Nitrospirillum amazonense]